MHHAAPRRNVPVTFTLDRMEAKPWILQRLAIAYALPVLAALPMFVPWCNSSYLGHAGVGYLLMPLGFIAAVAGICIILWRVPAGNRRAALYLAGASLGGYVLGSLVLAFLGAHAMNACFAKYVNATVSTREWLLVWALLFPPLLPVFA